jgi:hypothetical protein
VVVAYTGDRCVAEFFFSISSTDLRLFVVIAVTPSSFTFPLFLLFEGCTRVRPSVQRHTRPHFKSVFRLGGVGADMRADHGICIGRWAINVVCLGHVGMHVEPHLRGMCASVVAQVVIMGRSTRGTIGSRGGE